MSSLRSSCAIPRHNSQQSIPPRHYGCCCSYTQIIVRLMARVQPRTRACRSDVRCISQQRSCYRLAPTSVQVLQDLAHRYPWAEKLGVQRVAIGGIRATPARVSSSPTCRHTRPRAQSEIAPEIQYGFRRNPPRTQDSPPPRNPNLAAFAKVRARPN